MAIDNLMSTDMFVEMPYKTRITVNKEQNNDGILRIDDNGNALISMIDSGDTPLTRLAKYKGKNSLMLYNDITKQIELKNSGESLSIDLDFIKGTEYYLGAKRFVTNNRVKNTFEIDLEGLKVFKMFLHGREVFYYKVEGDTVMILGIERELIDDFTDLVIYAYDTNEIINDDYSFVIEYNQYESIWDGEDFWLLGDYFDRLIGFPIKHARSLSISQNLVTTPFTRSLRYSTKLKTNAINNTVDLGALISDSCADDFVHYVRNNMFRLILIDPVRARCVIVNNCRLDNGSNLIYDKNGNTKKITLSCGNYIDITEEDPSYYGLKLYGKGLYSASTAIYNSHRLGVGK